jgi:ABC-2 type transport system ATP-binding protein
VVSVQESSDQPYRGTGALPRKAEVEDVLSKLKGAKKVVELPTDDRAHTFEMTSEKDVDIRADIFRLIADKGWVMLELHRDTQTLEDVFRHLTIGDERRNRVVGAAPSNQEDDDDDDDEDEDDSDDNDDEDEK